MCNPRRIICRATRKIAEAWRAEIQRAATARDVVESQARLVQPITDLLPPPARRAFEQAMKVSPEWQWTGSEYRKAVPGGHIAYRPDTGELEIAVSLSIAIEAVGTATLVTAGEVTDEVNVEETGIWYRDGYAGLTHDVVNKKTQAAAERRVGKEAERRKAALKFDAEEKARHALSERAGEAETQARRSAEEQLTLRAAEVRSDLDLQANEQLEAVQAETLKDVFQLVAAGYSSALQAYAAEHGENLEVSEHDGVIEVQFEMER